MEVPLKISPPRPLNRLEIKPKGDGSFLVSKSTDDRVYLTVREAAKRARCSTCSILRLLHFGALEGRRPTPRKILVLEESLETHLQRCEDPEYWDDQKRAVFDRFRVPLD